MNKVTLELTSEEAEAVAFAISRCQTSLSRKIVLTGVQMKLEEKGFKIDPPLVHICRSCGVRCPRMTCHACWMARASGPRPWAKMVIRFPAYVTEEEAIEIERKRKK